MRGLGKASSKTPQRPVAATIVRAGGATLPGVIVSMVPALCQQFARSLIHCRLQWELDALNCAGSAKNWRF
jgi:hypothetical protein